MPELKAKNVDYMVDLETVGRWAGCPILTIGAVIFDRNGEELGDEFYQAIEFDSCLDVGLVADPETHQLWMQQSPEARAAAWDDQNKLRIDEALTKFTSWIRQHSQMDQTVIWGNGSGFDNEILKLAFVKCGLTVPWKFWNDRDLRTLKDIAPSVALVREGTHHHALDDAKYQARLAMKMFAAMREKQTAIVKAAKPPRVKPLDKKFDKPAKRK